MVTVINHANKLSTPKQKKSTFYAVYLNKAERRPWIGGMSSATYEGIVKTSDSYLSRNPDEMLLTIIEEQE